MKKIVLSLMVVATLAACNSKSDLNTNKDVILTDTSSMYRSNMNTDTGSVIETSALTTGRSTAVANRRATNNNRATTSHTHSNTNRSYGNNSGSNGGYSNSGQNNTVYRKRGWSKAAKGAVIGGVGGAVVGGVVKGGKGAVVGGVVGAAGGYIIGRSKDKRDGRVRR